MSVQNEKLIEEAAKAIYALDPDRQAWDGDAYGFLEPGAERGRKRAIAQAGAALAVFEKAHTPTDDERRDLIGAASAAFEARGGAPDWEEDAIARDLIIRWHLRGFEDGEKFGRRSEVPEPSADLTREQRHTLVEDAVDAIERNATNRTHAYNIWNNLASDERFVRAIMTLVPNRGLPEPQGKPSDNERTQDDRRAAAHDLRDIGRAELDVVVEPLGWDGYRITAEPQGEPSDAAVDAAWKVIDTRDARSITHEDIRDALRAAGGVR